MISKCNNFAQKKYKSWHDWVGKVTNGELCKRLEETCCQSDFSKRVPFNAGVKKLVNRKIIIIMFRLVYLFMGYLIPMFDTNHLLTVISF